MTDPKREMIRPTFSQLMHRHAAGVRMWRRILELLLAEFVRRPRCPCDHLSNLLQQQEKWRAWDEFDRWSEPYLREVVVEFAANRLGWDTLRGGGKRRRRLEARLTSLLPKMGRPRKLLLTTVDLEWARRFVAHFRTEGRAHVEDQLSGQVRVRLDVPEPDKFGVQMQPMLKNPDVRSALEIAEEATDLTDRMWSRRRERIARRFLAELVGCSESTLKKNLTDRVELPLAPYLLLEPIVKDLRELHWREEWKDEVAADEDLPVTIPILSPLDLGDEHNTLFLQFGSSLLDILNIEGDGRGLHELVVVATRPEDLK